MKKILLFIFLLFFLMACIKIDYRISLDRFSVDTPNLYVPKLIKNNSSFIGFEVINHKPIKAVEYKKDNVDNGMVYTSKEIYPEVTFDLLKNYPKNNKLFLRAVFLEYSIEELFSFEALDDDNYAVSKTDILPYPREITIPNKYLDKKVTEIAKFGFFGLTDLTFVNLPDSLGYINIYGFANTNLYRIEYDKNADETAFYNTLLNGQDFKKINLNFIEDEFRKTVKINDLEIEVVIDLNGGKIIEEEVNLVIFRPKLENEIFDSFENEEGKKLLIKEDKNYLELSLKDYYRYIVGLEYKINSRKITNDIFYFEYIEKSDSFGISLIDEDLSISKLVLPDTYLGKPITQISKFNNKYISELVLGKNIEEIKCEFITPNLSKVEFNKELKKIHPYAFSGCLLTEVELPENLKRLEAGVFSYTFIKDFKIPSFIDYIDGSSFARCIDISFESDNPLFLVSNDNKKVYYGDKDYLIIHSQENGYMNIDLRGVKKIGVGVFSYFMIQEIKNIVNLKIIDKYAFYNATIKTMFDLERIDEVSENAFLKFEIQNN